jgi:hypothetical protein
MAQIINYGDADPILQSCADKLEVFIDGLAMQYGYNRALTAMLSLYVQTNLIAGNGERLASTLHDVAGKIPEMQQHVGNAMAAAGAAGRA